MYRMLKFSSAFADDSSLSEPTYGPREMVCSQSQDLEEEHGTVLIGPSDAEVTVSFGPVTTGYYLEIRADYPVKVRLNGASETQFTLNTNNVAAVNVGSPLPDQCLFVFTGTVTSLRLAPIASAATTARVKFAVSGDPLNSRV